MKYEPAKILGGIAWLTAIVASGMLVYQHIMGAALPGCGPTSACAGLATGAFGALFGVPVSILGLAYFLGLLLAWPVGKPARWIVGIGAMASLFYLGVMLATAKWCPYCVAVHIANGLLAATVFLTRVGPQAEINALDDVSSNPDSKNKTGLGTWLRMAGTMVAVTLVLTTIAGINDRSPRVNALKPKTRSTR